MTTTELYMYTNFLQEVLEIPSVYKLTYDNATPLDNTKKYKKEKLKSRPI